MRVGQGDVCVIRCADYFGLPVEHILSALRVVYHTAVNEGSSTDLPFFPVSLTFLPCAYRDLSTTSVASGAELVVGPSASNTPILHFKYYATPTGTCIHSRSNCKGLNAAGRIYSYVSPELPSTFKIGRCKICAQPRMKFEEVMVESDRPSMPPIVEERDDTLYEVNSYLQAVRRLRIHNIFASMKRFRVTQRVRVQDESAMGNDSDPNKGWMGFQVWLDKHPRPNTSPEDCVHVSLDCPRLRDSCEITMRWFKPERLPVDKLCIAAEACLVTSTTMCFT
jgi:hypothetical protein